MTIETASAYDATAGKPQRHANNWIVLLLVFTMAGVVESQAFGHLSAFRPLYLQQLGVPAANIATWTGVLASLGFVIGLPLLPFWGVWADRYSRKLIIVRSAYVEGVMFTVAALAPNVWVLAVAALCSGFVLGNTGVMLAMLADVTPRKRLGMAVGIASAGFPIGSSIGPFVGGLIAQGPGIRALLGIDASFSVLMGLVLTLIVREEAHKMATGETVGRMLRAAVHAIVSSPVVLRLFILYFVAMYGYSLARAVHPDSAATLVYRGTASACGDDRRDADARWHRDGDHDAYLGADRRYGGALDCAAYLPRGDHGGPAGGVAGAVALSAATRYHWHGTLPGRHRHDGHRVAGAAGAGGASRAYPQLLAATLATLVVPRPDHWRGAGPCRADAALRRRRGRVGGGADIRDARWPGARAAMSRQRVRQGKGDWGIGGRRRWLCAFEDR